MTEQIPNFVRALDVYWDTALVGRLMQNTAGSLSFAYDPDFLHSATVGISISLPLQDVLFEGDVVKAFFSRACCRRKACAFV